MKARKLLLIIFTIVISIYVNATREITNTHMFDSATSFNDFTTYITEIQHVDSAYIDKSNFLFSRENYPYQLQDYLCFTDAVTPTCITTFAKDQKEIEKKYFPMRKKYKRNGKYTIKYATATSFRYQGIAPQASGLKQEKAARREVKGAKKAVKITGRQAKRKQKLAKKGITETNQPVTTRDTKQ